MPIQQSQMMVEKLKRAGVEAKLVVKPARQHGWPDTSKEAALIVDWFDTHLKKQP